MVERILVLGLLAAAVLIAWHVLRRRATRARDADGLQQIGFKPGRPAILYFTAPGCAPCETVQRPALSRLADQAGGALQILEIDASAKPDLADAWGVLAVPTTFVIDHTGRPRRVNHGPTRERALLRQLADIGAPIEGLQSNPPPAAEAHQPAGPDEGSKHGAAARFG